MKSLKVYSLMFVFSLLILIPITSVAATSEPRAAARYCCTCGGIRPFTNCRTCADVDQNTPYHCSICGCTFDHKGLKCPEYEAFN